MKNWIYLKLNSLTMKKLKILFVNDYSSTAYLFEKYLNAEVDAIYFIKDITIKSVKNPLFFKEKDLLHHIEQIKGLSDKYDVFICLGWTAAAICYLANVKYVIHSVDAYIEPQHRFSKTNSSLKNYFFTKLFEETLQSADAIVSCGRFFTKLLKKYRDGIIEIKGFTEPDFFNPDRKKINLGEKKFTFFSPQRIEGWKGQLKMWEAIKKTKSDFVVLQTDWGQGKYYNEVMRKKPDKVKIIPKIKRSEMPSYYVSSDALLGQISSNNSSHVENEAMLCGIPVVCYTHYGFTTHDPFCSSDDPNDLAEYIDNVVENKNFRENLIKIQKDWITKTFDNKKNAEKWIELLKKLEKKPNRKSIFYLSILKLKHILKDK